MTTSTLIVDYLGVGLAADLPVSPNVPAAGSAFYYETDTPMLRVWDGSAWQPVVTGSVTGTVTHTGGALTSHAPIVGAGGNDEKALAAMTDGQLMIGHTGADPDLATITAGAGITVTNAAGSITIANSTLGTVTHTAGALTNHAPMVGAGSADSKTLAAMTDGQLLIGVTGSDPALNTLTAGPGVSIISGAGGISIAFDTEGVLHTSGDLVQYAPIIGGGGSDIEALGALTDGQIVIGSTGVAPVAATLTAGTGISITNGAGTITISTTVSDTGITQLTGDVTAGPGNGSQAATLANSGVTAATYGDSTHVPVLVVDAKGRITSASNVAVSAPSGITQLTGDATAGPGTGSQAVTLANSGVSAATYGTATAIPQITFDAKGRATVATTVALSTAGSSGKSSGGVNAISFLAAVVAATAAALPSYTYANGSSGVGATLTATANGALTIDGYTTVLNERYLIKDESGGNAKYNGVYKLTQVGTGGLPYILTRVTDFDQAAEMTAGVSVQVSKFSTTNANTSWTLESNVTTVGTTAVTFGAAGAAGVAALTDADFMTAMFDVLFGSGQNTMVYRNASQWTGLTIGSSGYALLSTGGSSAPAWTQILLNSHVGDITLTSLSDKDYLRWEASSSKWKNRTPTQVTADLISFSGSTAGLVPTGSGGDASKALLGDGSWGTLSSISVINDLTDVTITSAADKDILVYDSATSQWKNQRKEYTVAFSVVGIPGASQYMGFHRFKKAVTFPANFGAYLGNTSEAGGSVNATASTAFDVRKAANATPTSFSSVGSITFASSSVTPTFTTSGGTTLSFAQGDVIMIRAPSSADATFSDFFATLVGYET